MNTTRSILPGLLLSVLPACLVAAPPPRGSDILALTAPDGTPCTSPPAQATPQTEDDRINGKALMPPDEFERVWDDKGSKAYSDGSIWRPIPPSGYVAMGLVASRGYDKPSRNSVRCVRADLVIASYINELIWNNKRSPAKLDFSAWSISPPGAAAGEVYLSPGTFVGAASYTKPSMHIAAYSLRMQIPLHTAYPPPAPALSGDRQPAPFEKAVVSNISKLAWFTVKDQTTASTWLING